MIDINAIINAAIAEAVDAHITDLKQTYANNIGAMAALVTKLEEENMRQRMNLDKLVERVSDLHIKFQALDALVLNGANAPLKERVTKLEESNAVLLKALIGGEQPTPATDLTDPTTGMDYFQRDALTNAFVEKLNAQEWFWDKINAHIEGTIERLGDDSVTTDTFPELFAVEFNRKVGSNDLLGRDEVAEVVRELWSEEFEPEVRDIAERTVDDFDMDDKIRRAVRDYDFSDAVECVIEDMDFSSKIEDVLEDFDMDSKIERGIDDYDFDFESKIRDVLRNARIDISL